MNLKLNIIRKTLNITAVTLLLLLFGGNNLSAQTVNTWLGGTTDWNLGTNWSEGYPGFDHNLIIPENPVGGNLPSTILEIIIETNTGKANNAAPPTVFMNAADLTVNGGPVTIPMELRLTLESSLVGVTISSTGTLTVEGELTVVNQSNFGIVNDGILTNDGGIIQVDNIGNIAFFNEDAITNAATMSNINGGQILIGQSFDDAGPQTIDDDGIQNIGGSAVFVNDGSTIVIDNVGAGGTTNQPIRNTGGASFTNQNFGEILIGQNSVDLPANGLGNFGESTTFINDLATISIDNVNLNGLANASNASFTNQESGQIFIGQNGGTGDVGTGINNEGAGTVFTNTGEASTIRVDNTNQDGVLNEDGAVFTNEVTAEIYIGGTLGSIGPAGADISSGFAGLKNSDATFNNTSEGLLCIGDSDYGIWNVENANFNNDNSTINIADTRRHIRNDDGTGFMNTNNAFISLGQDGGVGHTAANGIAHAGTGTTFINSNSIIRIDYTIFDGIVVFNEATFSNSLDGIIRIGESGGNLGGDGIQVSNDGTFNNTGDVFINNVGQNGVRVESGGTFNNLEDSELQIGLLGAAGNIGEDGILHLSGVFTNDGNISIENVEEYGIENLSSFTIGETGTINISQIGLSAIDNINMMENSGGITIGENSGVTLGISNGNSVGNFTNKSGGEINIISISNPGVEAILNTNSGTFTNENGGKIAMGQEFILIHGNGINNLATFNNDGEILIDNLLPPFLGIYNLQSTTEFNNEANGEIKIGLLVGASTTIAIQNQQQATFNNNGGLIEIINTRSTGLLNQGEGIFNNLNEGILNIGQSGGTIAGEGIVNLSATFLNEAIINIDKTNVAGAGTGHGIRNSGESSFTNTATGRINMGQVPLSIGIDGDGIVNEISGFDNSGIIIIEKISGNGISSLTGSSINNMDGGIIDIGTSGIDGIANVASILNDDCSIIILNDNLNNTGDIINNGLFTINTNQASIVGNFVNNGIVEDIQGSFDDGFVTNNEIILEPVFSDRCGELSMAFTLGGASTFNVLGIFTDAAATISAGTYDATTNTFVPNASIEGTTTLYAQIEDPDGGCTQVVSFEVTAIALFITDITAINDECPIENNGSIIVNGVSTADPVEYSLDGVVFQSSNTFLNLDAGDYTVTVRYASSPFCTSSEEITVAQVADTEDPIAICAAGLVLELDEEGVTSIPAVELDGGSTDNCGIMSYEVAGGADLALDCGDFGDAEFTLIVTDNSGNTGDCTGTITVINPTPTVILCRPPVHAPTDEGVCGASNVPGILPPVVISNNCEITDVYSDAPLFFEVETIIVTWTVEDASGSATTCEQMVTIEDVDGPTLTCQTNINGVVGNNCTFSASALLAPVATDICSAVVSVTNDAPATLPVGIHTVTWTAADALGNESICEQTVSISDAMSPVITSCPDDIEVEATTAAGASVIWNVIANDNCTEELLWLNSHSSGAIYPLGETEVAVAVYDESGNSADCEFTITVNPMMLNVAQVSGLVTNETDMPMEGAAITLSGAMANTSITDELGGFYFQNVPLADDITLLPYLDENPMNGVSTYDLILINKHVLGIEALDSPYKMIAADVNKTGSVSTLDIVQLRKMILFIDDDFTNNTSWRFVPQAYNFPNPANPFANGFPEFLNINNVDADITDADFIAIKTGDINGNAAPSANLLGVDDRTEPEPFVFKVDNQKVEKGEKVKIDFIANETKVEGYQFTLNFDEKLNFEELINGVATEDNFGFTFLSDNAITVSWNGKMTNESRAFSLAFTANEQVELSEALTINSSLTRAEAYTMNNGIANVVLDFQNGKPATTNFALYQNTPNPFNGVTTIGFELPNAGNTTFTLTDVAGKTIREWNNDYAKGYHEIQLNPVDFPSAGVYYYTLKTDNEIASKRLILAK